MTQPDYVPLSSADRVRAVERLPVPDGWRPDRPADLVDPSVPRGPRFGHAGPDGGYGIKLARRVAERARVPEGETLADAVAGCFSVGSKRSAVLGRAPVIYDMELAFTLWGFMEGAPADLIAFRRPLFASAAHHYWDQRGIVDRVPEATLLLSPADVRARLTDWKSLLLVG